MKMRQGKTSAPYTIYTCLYMWICMLLCMFALCLCMFVYTEYERRIRWRCRRRRIRERLSTVEHWTPRFKRNEENKLSSRLHTHSQTMPSCTNEMKWDESGDFFFFPFFCCLFFLLASHTPTQRHTHKWQNRREASIQTMWMYITFGIWKITIIIMWWFFSLYSFFVLLPRFLCLFVCLCHVYID